MDETARTHWDAVYASNPVSQLGWYEAQSQPSLQMMKRCALSANDRIVDVGSGASMLIGGLLEMGFRRVCSLDISAVALEKARDQLGPQQAVQVSWLHADVTRLPGLSDIAFWHDRAVFHFFTEESQRQDYRTSLLTAIRPGGYALIAAFALGGASRCSGLPVQNYDRTSLQDFFAPDLELIDSQDYLYYMPSGDARPYIYVLFRRK